MIDFVRSDGGPLFTRWPQFKAVAVTRGPKGWEQTTITFVRVK